MSDWDWMSLSTNIDIRDIKKYPTLPWRLYNLSRNSTITVKDLLEINSDVNYWDWRNISRNIDINEVISNPYLPWSKGDLSWNKGINKYVIEELEIPNSMTDWCIEFLSATAPMDYIANSKRYIWDINYISTNEDLKMKHIPLLEKNGYKCHDIYQHMGSFINIQEVCDNPLCEWDRSDLSCNPGITMNLVKNLNLPNSKEVWYFPELIKVLSIQDIKDNRLFFSESVLRLLVRNPNIRIRDLEYFDVDIHWHTLSFSINIMEVRKHPHLPWDKYGLSMNPGITIEDVFYLGYSRPKMVVEIKNYPLYWDISINSS